MSSMFPFSAPNEFFSETCLEHAWGWGWGRVGNPGKLLWQGSAIDWSLDNTAKEGFLHWNSPAWEGSELWALVPGGGLAGARWTAVCKNSCFELICSVLSAVKCHTVPIRNRQKLKQDNDDPMACLLSFGETLRLQDRFRPSFCCSLE